MSSSGTAIIIAYLALSMATLALGACDREPAVRRQTTPNPPSIGHVDIPAPDSSVEPVFTVTGWAADESGISHVRIYLDDELVATFPPSIARPDVDLAFPGVASSGPRHGFTATIDAESRTGDCTIRAEALDRRGALTRFATVTVRIVR
jgi:hypothetical protein